MSFSYLLLSIVFSTLINLIFNWFKTYQINKIQAIVVNYFVCFVIGFSFSDQKEIIRNLSTEWFQYCFILGTLFVAIFFCMALTTEKFGVSVNAVSTKMSVVIPVIFVSFFTGENISFVFVIGLIFSLISIYLITQKEKSTWSKKLTYLPILVFLGSGTIDTSLKILESSYSHEIPLSTITYSIFLGAFIIGFFVLLLTSYFKFNQWNTKSTMAGIVLGVPNYFSIFFLLYSIQAFSMKSSFVFGINNIAIVLLSTIFSVIIFKEKLLFKNKLGIFTSVLSIILIAYAS